MPDTTLLNRLIFFPQDVVTACRCGTPSLQEACCECEQYVCQDCAVFVDPQSRQPARPSELLARQVRGDFLAHRACMLNRHPKSAPFVYNRDVPLMVRIIKDSAPPGRSLSR